MTHRGWRWPTASLALHAVAAVMAAYALIPAPPPPRCPPGPDPLTLPLGGCWSPPPSVARPRPEPEEAPAAPPPQEAAAAIAWPVPDVARMLAGDAPGAEEVQPEAPRSHPPRASAPAAPPPPVVPGVADGIPVVSRTPPDYPLDARRHGQEGTVCLEVQIDHHGLPLTVTVERSSGHRLLDQAARRAVRTWRFAAGHAGSTRIRIAFRLATESPDPSRSTAPPG